MRQWIYRDNLKYSRYPGGGWIVGIVGGIENHVSVGRRIYLICDYLIMALLF